MGLSDTIIFHGCVGALIFSIALFATNVNQPANRFLGFVVAAIAINLGVAWALSNGLYDRYPVLHVLPFGIVYGLAPLMYFYVWFLCRNGSPGLHHLWWLAADYPHSIYHLMFGRDIVHPGLHGVLDKFGFLSLPVMAYYLWKALKLVKGYQQQLPHAVSNTEHVTLKWLRQFISLFLISIPLSLVFWLLVITSGLEFDDKWVAYGFYVISIYWLGIGGIRQPEVTAKPTHPPADPPLVHHVSQANIDLLISCMERDKLYLLPELSIRYLEDRLGLTSKQLSEILNKGLGKNFYVFINEYRVAEFKRRAVKDTHLTLAGLAMECGFNSKTTFQRVFKEITGEKPTEFIKKTTQ